MHPRDFWEWRPVDFHRKVRGYFARQDAAKANFRKIVTVLVNANRDTKEHPKGLTEAQVWPIASIDQANKTEEKEVPLISQDRALAAIERHKKLLEIHKHRNVRKKKLDDNS